MHLKLKREIYAIKIIKRPRIDPITRTYYGKVGNILQYHSYCLAQIKANWLNKRFKEDGYAYEVGVYNGS